MVALAAVNYVGVQKSAWLTRGIVAVVLAVLAAVVTACLVGGTAQAAGLDVGAHAGYCHPRIIEAIRYLVAGGITWRAMPPDFPAWDRVYAFYGER